MTVTTSESGGRAHRLDAWVRAHPLVVYSILVLLLITTFLALLSYGRETWGLANDRFFWRNDEYATLALLHSDYTVERFEEVLGAPLLRRTSRNGRWVELFFRRRDHWVQAVVPARGDTVAYFSVTSCSRDFTPTLRLPDDTPITLYRSSLASVGKEPFASDFSYAVRYRYAVYASSPPTFIESVTGPHAWNFKSFAWGYNGVCEFSLTPAIPRYAGDFFTPNGRTGLVSRLPKRLRREVRPTVTINTYAEWGPSTGYGRGWPPAVPLGVDEFVVGND